MRNKISIGSLACVLVGGLLFFCFLARAFTASAQTQPIAGSKSNDSSTPPQTASIPGRFIDITDKSYLAFAGQASHTPKKYLLETMGSGVALFDYDNDGL